MTNQKTSKALVLPALIVTLFFTASFMFFAVMTREPSRELLVGSEFQLEGFQKAKIVGISNGRAIVVLTNNVGHNSYEEMSLNTVEMLKSRPKKK